MAGEPDCALLYYVGQCAAAQGVAQGVLGEAQLNVRLRRHSVTR